MNPRIIVCALAVLPIAARAQDAIQPAAQPTATAVAPTTTSDKPVPQATSSAPLPDKLLLRLRLQPAQAFDLRMTTELKQTQIIQGRKMTIEAVTRYGMRYDVQSVAPDGTIQIKLTYHDISATQTLIGMDGKPHTSDAARAFRKALMGLNLIVKITPDGRVVELRGLPALMRIVLSRLPDGTPEDRQVTASVRKTLNALFSDKNIKQMMRQVTMGIYPTTPIGIGATWTQTTALEQGFALVSSNKRTLVARAGGIATIKEAGTVRMDTKRGAIPIGAASATFKVTGVIDGSSRIDEANGVVRYARLTMRMGGRIQVRVNGAIKPGEPRDLSSPTYQLVTSTVTMQPITAPAPSRTPTP